jgi:universal stress protein A
MYSHLLVAVDLGDDSYSVAEAAARLALALDAKFSLVFVEPGVGNLSLMDIEVQLETSHDSMQQQHQKRLDELADRLPAPAENRVVACGDVVKQIEATRKALGADLIIAGEHHSFWHITHTDRSLVKTADCDVLTVKL